MPSRAKREKYANDPYVPISPNALRWALKREGVTASDLAKRIGASQQAISYLTIGEPEQVKRCRRSRFKAIAKALRLPETFLGGEGGLLLPRGARSEEVQYTDTVRLAVARLCMLASKAYARDCKRAATEGQEQPHLRDGISAVLSSLTELISVRSWQSLLLVNDETPADERIWDWTHIGKRRPKRPEIEAALLGLVDAFEQVLAPWFEGRAQLNYGWLRDFTVTPATPPEPPRTNPREIIPTWESWRNPAHSVKPLRGHS